jgi:two-component system, OmpR family, alkaline phosphatase synthesis response regulator PhoP
VYFSKNNGMANQTASKVLIVDDDTDILQLLKYNLEKDGFKVRTVENNFETFSIAKEFAPDLIILDIMMPPPNGIALCKLLRSCEQFKHTYIFFLSALSDQVIQREALDAGGDEYVEKIMGLRALTYKIKAVLKGKFVIHKNETEIRVGDLIINRNTSSVTVGGEIYLLSKPEFELLFFLAQNVGRVFTLENLIQNIWGSELFLLSSSVDQYFSNLQRKVGKSLIIRTDNNRYTLAPGRSA